MPVRLFCVNVFTVFLLFVASLFCSGCDGKSDTPPDSGLPVATISVLASPDATPVHVEAEVATTVQQRQTGLMNRDNALVIDLSASNDFEKGHIAGSKSVQPSQFDPENKLLANAKELPVVVVCRTGQGSADAAKRLKKAGFEKVYVLDGGVAAWQQADLPLVKGR